MFKSNSASRTVLQEVFELEKTHEQQ